MPAKKPAPPPTPATAARHLAKKVLGDLGANAHRHMLDQQLTEEARVVRAAITASVSELARERWSQWFAEERISLAPADWSVSDTLRVMKEALAPGCDWDSPDFSRAIVASFLQAMTPENAAAALGALGQASAAPPATLAAFGDSASEAFAKSFSRPSGALARSLLSLQDDYEFSPSTRSGDSIFHLSIELHDLNETHDLDERKKGMLSTWRPKGVFEDDRSRARFTRNNRGEPLRAPQIGSRLLGLFPNAFSKLTAIALAEAPNTVARNLLERASDLSVSEVRWTELFAQILRSSSIAPHLRGLFPLDARADTNPLVSRLAAVARSDWARKIAAAALAGREEGLFARNALGGEERQRLGLSDLPAAARKRLDRLTFRDDEEDNRPLLNDFFDFNEISSFFEKKRREIAAQPDPLSTLSEDVFIAAFTHACASHDLTPPLRAVSLSLFTAFVSHTNSTIPATLFVERDGDSPHSLETDTRQKPAALGGAGVDRDNDGELAATNRVGANRPANPAPQDSALARSRFALRLSEGGFWRDEDFSELTRSLCGIWRQNAIAKQTMAHGAELSPEIAFSWLRGERETTQAIYAHHSRANSAAPLLHDWPQDAKGDNAFHLAARVAQTLATGDASPAGEASAGALCARWRVLARTQLHAAGVASFGQAARMMLGLEGDGYPADFFVGGAWARPLLNAQATPDGGARLFIPDALAVLARDGHWQAAPSEALLASVESTSPANNTEASAPRSAPPLANEHNRLPKMIYGWRSAFSSAWSESVQKTLETPDKKARLLHSSATALRYLTAHAAPGAARDIAPDEDQAKQMSELATTNRLANLPFKAALFDDTHNGLPAGRDVYTGLWIGLAQAVDSVANELTGVASAAPTTPIAQIAFSIAGDDVQRNVHSRWLSALDWAGQNPEIARKLHAQNAASRFSLAFGFRSGGILDERIEQRAKALWESEGLSPAAWRLLAKTQAAAADFLIPDLGDAPWSMNARGDFDLENKTLPWMRNLAALLNAATDANLPPEHARALLALSQHEGYSMDTRWFALETALALPTRPETGRESAERKAEEEKQIAKITCEWRRKIDQKITRALKKPDIKRIQALREELAAGVPNTEIEAKKPERPAPRVETEAQRSIRLELTRALGAWAAESFDPSSPRVSVGHGLRRAEQERFFSKLGDLKDWLTRDPDARERLPRRFGVNALFERQRRWHDDLAREQAMIGAERLVAQVRKHAHDAVKFGHAPDIAAVEAAVQAVQWPMAIPRVEGIELEASRLTQTALADLAQDRAIAHLAPAERARRVAEKQAHALASAAQTPLAGWVAVGLATEIELKNEGVAMSHCVGSYVTDCATAKSRIYHVTNPAGRSVGTLELKVDEHASKRGDWVWSVAQFKGAHNALISNPTAKLFAQKVAEAYGAAARANRLGLRPARETAKTDSGRALDNNPRESAPEIASGMPRDEALGQRLTARRAQNLDYVPGDDSLDLRFPR